MCNLGHADLGVSHRRSGVSVNGAKIALAVYQRVPQREVLRHANDCVVDSRVAVRVVLTNNITDDTR